MLLFFLVSKGNNGTKVHKNRTKRWKFSTVVDESKMLISLFVKDLISYSISQSSIELISC